MKKILSIFTLIAYINTWKALKIFILIYFTILAFFICAKKGL
jgi:hypothetical protein